MEKPKSPSDLVDGVAKPIRQLETARRLRRSQPEIQALEGAARYASAHAVAAVETIEELAEDLAAVILAPRIEAEAVMVWTDDAAKLAIERRRASGELPIGADSAAEAAIREDLAFRMALAMLAGLDLLMPRPGHVLTLIVDQDLAKRWIAAGRPAPGRFNLSPLRAGFLSALEGAEPGDGSPFVYWALAEHNPEARFWRSFSGGGEAR